MEDSRTSRFRIACLTDAAGWRLRSVDGAVIEDVSVTNITMRDVYGAPIFMRLGARMRGPEDVSVGKIRRVILSNITCAERAGLRADLFDLVGNSGTSD